MARKDSAKTQYWASMSHFTLLLLLQGRISVAAVAVCHQPHHQTFPWWHAARQPTAAAQGSCLCHPAAWKTHCLDAAVQFGLLCSHNLLISCSHNCHFEECPVQPPASHHLMSRWGYHCHAPAAAGCCYICHCFLLWPLLQALAVRVPIFGHVVGARHLLFPQQMEATRSKCCDCVVRHSSSCLCASCTKHSIAPNFTIKHDGMQLNFALKCIGCPAKTMGKWNLAEHHLTMQVLLQLCESCAYHLVFQRLHHDHRAAAATPMKHISRGHQ